MEIEHNIRRQMMRNGDVPKGNVSFVSMRLDEDANAVEKI